MQGIQMQGIANPSARSAPPMLPKRTPDKRKKKSESPARSPASIEESTAGFERQSSSSRSSVRGLGRGMSFRPLAQMRFKTLNDLFPSRMRPHDGEEEEDAPVVIEDEVEAKPYTRGGHTHDSSNGNILERRNTLSSFDADLMPAGFKSRRKSQLMARKAKQNVCVLHPHSKTRYNWDMTTLVMMAWVVMDVPFSVAFNVENPPNNGWNWHRVCGTAVDAFFMCDVVLNFNTGIELANGSVSMRRVDIAKAYLKSWFWVDIMSGFPLDLVVNGGQANHNNVLKLAKASRVVRMFKLIRLLRMARVMRVVSRLEYTMSTQEAMRTLWKFFAVVVVTCHLFTCIFYMIGIETNGPDAWANGVSGGESNFDNYVAGFYWAVMTTTTIGYGDVSSAGTPQRIFGVFAMVVGALLFGYGVSNVVNIVEELRASERVFREKMDTFNQYMRSQNMPIELQDAIREYLKNVKRCQDDRVSVEEEVSLLSQLSLGLREEIAEATNERYLKDMPFFEGEDPMVVMEIAFSMERRYLGPGEDVVSAGERGNEMFFVLEGRVEVLVPLARAGPRMMKRVAYMDKGQYFGEIALLEPGHLRSATIRTVTFCELRCLSSTAFNVITTRYPHFRESMVETLKSRKREHKSSGGSGLGTTSEAADEVQKFDSLARSDSAASNGDERESSSFGSGPEDGKSDDGSFDGRLDRSGSFSTLLGDALKAQPRDLPVIHETTAPNKSTPSSMANIFTRSSSKVDPWMNANTDGSVGPGAKPRELSSENNNLETILATMTALVEENRLMRGQMSELSSEVRRLTTAQEEQQASAVKLTDTVLAQAKVSDFSDGGSKKTKTGPPSPAVRVNNGNGSGSSNDSDYASTMRTLKPMGPPTVRRVASIDRPATVTRSSTPVRRPPPSPRAVLREPVAEFEL